MMDSIERKLLRRALLDAGLSRVDASEDFGDGAYSETFRSPGGDEVTINWTARAAVPAGV